jgi:acyl-coenzyme A synthetase/AMP-(fatty) acid ligase
MAHPAVEEAAAIGVPDEVQGTSAVCFVFPATSGSGPQISWKWN